MIIQDVITNLCVNLTTVHDPPSAELKTPGLSCRKDMLQFGHIYNGLSETSHPLHHLSKMDKRKCEGRIKAINNNKHKR